MSKTMVYEMVNENELKKKSAWLVKNEYEWLGFLLFWGKERKKIIDDLFGCTIAKWLVCAVEWCAGAFKQGAIFFLFTGNDTVERAF